MSYKRVFLVVSDVVDENISDIIACDNMPTLDDPHPDNIAALATNIEARQIDDSGTAWEVTVTYSTDEGSGGGTSESPDNPLLEFGTLELNDIKYQQEIRYDLDGKPIANALGEFYDPPLAIDANRTQVIITRNEAQHNPNQAMVPHLFPSPTKYVSRRVLQTARNTINEKDFLGYEPGIAKLSAIRARPASFIFKDDDTHPTYGQRVYYRQVTYEIDICEKRRIWRGNDRFIVRWQPKLLHVGLCERLFKDKDDKWINTNIMNDNAPITKPVPIYEVEGEGGMILRWRKDEDDVDLLEFQDFRVYRQMGWDALNFSLETLR